MDNIRIKIRINNKTKTFSLNDLTKSFLLNKTKIPNSIMVFLKPALFTNIIGLVSNVFSISEFRSNYYVKTKAYDLILVYSDLDDIIYSFKPNIFPDNVSNPEQKEYFVLYSLKLFLRSKFLNYNERNLLSECYRSITNFQQYLIQYSSISKRQRIKLQKQALTLYLKERNNQPVLWNRINKKWIIV